MVSKLMPHQRLVFAFLRNPGEIRRALAQLAGPDRRLDVAVAFVGDDWRDTLRGFDTRLRVICWLTSTNTNPMAVRQLIRHTCDGHQGRRFRQWDNMHAKVYLAAPAGAIIGSANLSRRALAAEPEISGQDEAAVPRA
jgi:phosphatidylserine/phosphatidylglycerophosphate/cardiolipin synthase-like enzyme